MSQSLSNTDVVILCGGKGERLREIIGNMPKPMALINKTPFLRILIDYIASFGCKRFILCVGYEKEAIKKYFQDNVLPIEVIFSEETHSLGTGGAVKNAYKYIKNSPFLVINGDSLFKIDYNNFMLFHEEKKGDCSIALFESHEEKKDYGGVVMDSASRISSFNEKKNSLNKQTFFNGGIYLFQKELFTAMPDNDVFSLEYDFFPRLTSKNFFGYSAKEKFIDIGTPSRYQQAQKLLERG
ncbi:NDP-sugar synthase [Candidatus Omnitrophota bacterium]